MIPTSSTTRGLTWSKISKKAGWELQHNGVVMGALQRTNLWKSEFQATTYHGSWMFRRKCGFHPITEIVDANGVQIATLKQNLTGAGTLTFSDGQTFQLKWKGFWRPVWTLFAGSDQALFSIDSHAKTVEPISDLQLPEARLNLLMVFAWHIIQQASEDAAATAAIVVATSAVAMT